MLESGALDLETITEESIRKMLEIYSEYYNENYEEQVMSLESGIMLASKFIPVLRSLGVAGCVRRDVAFI